MMRAATAQIAGERGLHVVDRCIGTALEQRDGRHHHAVRAIAALRGLLGDERRLNAVRLVRRAEAFDRRDACCADARHRQRARSRGLAVHQHGAGAALAQTAAELHAGKAESIAQNVEQRFVGIANLHVARFAVDA